MGAASDPAPGNVAMGISRRTVLEAGIAVALSPAVVSSAGNPADLTATQAAAAIRDGDMTSRDYVEALIGQDEHWAAINAFTARDHEALRASAAAADKLRASGAKLGPLHGVPVALKDNIATAALPTTAGTAALRNYRPRANAAAAQKLFDAGALLFGKNNMHELATGITNNNPTFGAARNPYDPALIPGGSSGGTGAAIAARVVPAGLGTDTGGSVRIPASLCGTTGFRPTSGRYPGAGLVPYPSAMATAGPMARCVADLALFDTVITGEPGLPATRLEDLRIGVPQRVFFDDLDAEVARLLRSVLELLRQAGVTLVHESVRGLEELMAAGRGSPSMQEAQDGYSSFFGNSGIDAEQFVSQVADPRVRERLARSLLGGTGMPSTDGPTAAEIRQRYRDLMQSYFVDHRLDAMIIPPTPLPARPIGHDATVALNGRQVPTFQTYVRNTLVGSAAGLPGVVLPAGLTRSGLPVGVEFDAPAGHDRQLLSLALAVEPQLPAIPGPLLE